MCRVVFYVAIMVTSTPTNASTGNTSNGHVNGNHQSSGGSARSSTSSSSSNVPVQSLVLAFDVSSHLLACASLFRTESLSSSHYDHVMSTGGGGLNGKHWYVALVGMSRISIPDWH
jgi:hypothetical protein